MTEDNIFYIVSDEYVDYLLKVESHVMQNKPQERTYHRKYVGILTEINGFKYFVPMSSPKDKDYANGKIKKNNLTTIYIRSKEKLYGTLRFNSMIPVPESELSLYRINDEGDFSYKLLMLAEYSFCKENRDKIEKTAKNLYEKKCSASEEEFPVGRIVIDFKKVEEACGNYKK
ncbi:MULTISPECIES: type III toxin-antitoxin system ToxN/AbiQ family toxin [unclassified Treponema]|uniref:type III toxin-antitoxin system ToxN/AbiQ family toxin n=1 Tax=unclassified Treponema TaxID=2638727 RepID=UPI0025EE4173|nr:MULTISPECIES: type III toxin-antitoxin system ToxN/AbiQ family toxin [unclassified Treponema]